MMACKISERLSGAVPVNKCVLTWLSLANGAVQLKVSAFLWLNLSAYLIFIVAQPGTAQKLFSGPICIYCQLF